jgi:hypothetical protein
MLKINIFIFLCIVFVIISYSFKVTPKKAVFLKSKNLKNIQKENIALNPEHQKENRLPEVQVKEKIPYIETTVEKGLLEAEIVELKKFKTADEIFQKLFPQLESELGSEMIAILKANFPKGYLLKVITSEQKIEYRKILNKMINDINTISETYNGRDLLLEEILQKKAEFAIIQEFYLPQFMNILNEEQQKQMAKNFISDKEYFDHYRVRKAKGLPLEEDISVNYNQIKNDPKLQKMLLDRQKELEENPLLKK